VTEKPNSMKLYARIRENPKKCLFVFPTEKPGKLTFIHDEIVNIIHKIKVHVLKLLKNVAKYHISSFMILPFEEICFQIANQTFLNNFKT
jgi:hypothetical protein